MKTDQEAAMEYALAREPRADVTRDYYCFLAGIEYAQAWQPIETAPKDGTPFLAIEKTEYMGDIYAVCTYVDEYLDVTGVGGYEVETEINPTHWKHLPKAP